MVLGGTLTLPALGIPGAGAMTRDSCFVEALRDNTASGKTATGMRYNLYFVEGGEVTYAAPVVAMTVALGKSTKTTTFACLAQLGSPDRRLF